MTGALRPIEEFNRCHTILFSRFPDRFCRDILSKLPREPLHYLSLALYQQRTPAASDTNSQQTENDIGDYQRDHCVEYHRTPSFAPKAFNLEREANGDKGKREKPDAQGRNISIDRRRPHA